MIENSKIIKVTNRSNGRVGYTIPDLNNLHRSFIAGETKEVSMEELRKLSWIAGGKVLLDKYLIIEDQDAIREIMGEVEPEYYYTEEDVVNLLTNGTLEQLQDCLDFASEGVIELVKNMAVKLPVNSVAMRQEILKKTGFNVDKAIMVNEESAEDAQPEEEKSGRRAAPINASANTTAVASGRRAAAPETSKYKNITFK